MATLKTLDEITVGLRTMQTLTGVDRDVIRQAIARSEIKPAGTAGGHPVYRLKDAIGALFERRGEVDPAMLTPTDRKNLADAKLKEHALQVRAGEYLPREAVRSGAARAFAVCANQIRSIPDAIERKTGVDPKVIDLLEAAIDGTLTELADDLERIHRRPDDALVDELVDG